MFREVLSELEAVARRLHELSDSMENSTISRDAFHRELRNGSALSSFWTFP